MSIGSISIHVLECEVVNCNIYLNIKEVTGLAIKSKINMIDSKIKRATFEL